MSEEKKVFELREIEELFDTHFFPKIQEFSKKIKDLKLPEEEVVMYNVFLKLQVPFKKEVLKWNDIPENKKLLQIQAITQKDLDEANENSKKD